MNKKDSNITECNKGELRPLKIINLAKSVLLNEKIRNVTHEYLLVKLLLDNRKKKIKRN